ncbi:MAG TPA: hypothetical protein DEA38_06330 [Stenotrophomonas sp.]|nr:hypothetical protein [Stenotrophomonas sp.]
MRHQIVECVGAHLGAEPGLQSVVQFVDFMFGSAVHQAFSGCASVRGCERRNSAIGSRVRTAARPSATPVARAGSHCMASASSSAMAAVPRQKLSCRLRFHSALASPSASASTPWKASVCAVLLHRLGQLAGQTPAPPAASAPLSAHRLRQLEEYIDAHRADALDVAALATAVGMEASAFGRALRAASGESPYVFLTRRRMHWAASELLQGRAVTEVALAAGYANPSKFSAAFRRVMGCAPSAWGRRSR